MSQLFHLVVRPQDRAPKPPVPSSQDCEWWWWTERCWMYQIALPTLEFWAILVLALAAELPFRALRLVLLIEAGTHLIFDALMCPYRIGERVRAKKLLRSVCAGMLLMWDRGLLVLAMVQATLAQGCNYLGRVPANIKFVALRNFRGWILLEERLSHLAS